MPAMGDSVAEGTVLEWHKHEGDPVTADETLVEISTDKVDAEVPAPVSGTVVRIHAAEGETVAVGALLAEIAINGATTPTASDEAPTEEAATGAEDLTPGKTIDIVTPTGGESVTEGTILEWSVKVGDTVKDGDTVVEISTDKVDMELPAPSSGTITEILAEEGETVTVGQVIARMTTSVSAAPAQGPPEAAVATSAGVATLDGDGDGANASPVAKRVAAQEGVSLSNVQGSARGGRITKADVLAFVARPVGTPAPPAPAARAPRPSEEGEERVRMTRLRRTIAARLKEAQNTAAMLTTFNEVDLSSVITLRTQYRDAFEKKHGVRLGFMSFFVKACVAALKEFPAVNAEIDGDDIVYKHFVHMGIAVGGPAGLVVPVVRNIDTMGFAEIEKAIADAGRRVRDGTLKLEELTGGTFSITNGGVYGSLLSTPILNPPQSGILGMHKVEDRPVAIAGKVEVRPMMYLALSYDHRIVDGKEAVSFLVRVKEMLEDPRRLLLEL